MKAITIHINVPEEACFTQSDMEGFASAIEADLKRTLVKGQAFAGNDKTGKRVDWYVPEVTIQTHVMNSEEA